MCQFAECICSLRADHKSRERESCKNRLAEISTKYLCSSEFQFSSAQSANKKRVFFQNTVQLKCPFYVIMSMHKVNLFPDVRRSAYVRIVQNKFRCERLIQIISSGISINSQNLYITSLLYRHFQCFFVDYRLPLIRRTSFFVKISK